jgi:hypothetical protein
VKFLFFKKKGIRQDLEDNQNNIELEGLTEIDRTKRGGRIGQMTDLH